MFLFQHFFFGAAGTAAFLTADLFPFLLLGGLLPQDLSFHFFSQKAARQKPIDRLRAVLLAFHHKTGGPVEKLNAGRCFIDVLAARAA